MKNIYNSLYNFFIVLKVLCPIISFLYAVLWCIGFLNISYYQIISIPFEPFAKLINVICPITIDYEGRLINMSYIVCSGLFLVFHYIFDFFAQRIIDLYNFEETKKERKRSAEVKKINIDLEKEFHKEIKRYSSFALLFNIIQDTQNDFAKINNEEFNSLKKKFYEHIIKNVKSKYQDSKGIISGKMFLVCDDFGQFDNFMADFINDIKAFKESNEKNNIYTDFTICVDAIKYNANILNALELLEKIDSFNYKNKVIATSAFKVRYEKSYSQKFKMTPLGVSRFFKEPDDYIDFELYSLKSQN